LLLQQKPFFDSKISSKDSYFGEADLDSLSLPFFIPGILAESQDEKILRAPPGGGEQTGGVEAPLGDGLYILLVLTTLYVLYKRAYIPRKRFFC
jgi:hypothetical protein